MTKPKPKAKAKAKPMPAATRGAAAIALAGLAVLALLSWQRFAPSAVEPAPDLGTGQYVRVDYLVDEREWGGVKPSLCEIVSRYGLDNDALAATLHINAGRKGCASPGVRKNPGDHVAIAVFAEPGYEPCSTEAINACATQSASPSAR